MRIADPQALEPLTGSVGQAGQLEKNASKDCVDELMRHFLFNNCLLSDIQVACTYLAIYFSDSRKGTVLLSFWQRRIGMLYFLMLNAEKFCTHTKKELSWEIDLCLKPYLCW